jgi:hypothetical protein
VIKLWPSIVDSIEAELEITNTKIASHLASLAILSNLMGGLVGAVKLEH